MTGAGAATTALYALLLILPLSALLARRLPVATTVKMALAWIAIFAAGYLVASLIFT